VLFRSAWAFGRLAGLTFPGPPCLAVATLPFLFLTDLFGQERFTIYGGNIASTLAGEFSFSISLSLALVFLGLVAGGLGTSRRRALAAVLLAATALCHLVPAMLAVVGAALVVALRPGLGALVRALTVGLVGGLLTAFWSVPFALRLDYLNDMGWEKETSYFRFLTAPSLWLLGLAATGVVVAVVFRLRPGLLLSATAALSGLAFLLLPAGRLYNARLLPFWYLCLYLLAGLAVAELGRLAVVALSAGVPVARARALGGRLADEGPWVALMPVGFLLVVLYYVATPLYVLPSWAQRRVQQSLIPSWVRWNYTGYEAKAAYPEYRGVIATMNDLGRSRGCGRAFWEYEPELDRLGTPMALMLLPYWTKGCIASMEGLYFESSATTPYHFLAQSELSLVPSRAQRDLPYRDLDVERGVEHLRLLGVRYYMALTPEAQAQARRNADLQLLASSGPWPVSYRDGVKQRTWEIFEVTGSELATPLANEPVVAASDASGAKEWQEAAVDWYMDPKRFDVLLAARGPRSWQRVPRLADELPRRPLPLVRVSQVRTSDDSLSFDVDRPGTPVLVKVSYFPNWRASGAEGPWRVTPNLMVVVPTSRHVELRYGRTPAEGLGWLLTAAGVVLVALMGRRRRPTGTAEEISDRAAVSPAAEARRPEAVPVN
jgi:hypothetical protein